MREREEREPGRSARPIIDDRRADMAHVEHESVNAAVLRDDVLGVDSHGG